FRGRAMTALPGALAENPALDRWVAFPAPGRVTVRTGKVEIGQGVLTAMMQIAAEELDVAPQCIAMSSGDTDLTPNEGFPAGSQSMELGGVGLRQACGEVRTRLLRHAADQLGCAADDLTVADGRVLRNNAPTSHDYWTLAATIGLNAAATGAARPKSK